MKEMIFYSKITCYIGPFFFLRVYKTFVLKIGVMALRGWDGEPA